MTHSFMTSVAFGILVASSVVTYPAVGANASESSRHSVHRHDVEYRAFVPPTNTVVRQHMPETDGLSRDANDCDYGCIDNGH